MAPPMAQAEAGAPAARWADPRVVALLLTPLGLLAAAAAWHPVAVAVPFGLVFVVLAAARLGGVWAGAAEGLYVAAVSWVALGEAWAYPPAGTAEPWWLPALFFLLLGVVAGAATVRNGRRLSRERASRQELAAIHARTLMTCADLVARRDQPTAHHCERVAQNACSIGRAYGLDDHALNALFWAGMLHDLGKVSIPTTILLKEGRLTDEEFEAVKAHPVVGARMLADISPRFHQIAQGVRSHHERWDGSGYPDGLAGDAIPVFGRILAVADVFEAMTAPRPYHPPLASAEVMRFLRERSGIDFDPDIVVLAGELYGRGVLQTHADDFRLEDLNSDIFTTGFWREQGVVERAS